MHERHPDLIQDKYWNKDVTPKEHHSNTELDKDPARLNHRIHGNFFAKGIDLHSLIHKYIYT